MATLNVIGCGRVGRTLARLWRERGPFAIGAVFDRTREKSAAATGFIGGGEAVGAISEMHAAEVWMIAPPDSRIAECAETLAATGKLRTGDIVFHCSGALSSSVLGAAARAGASTASVHPIKSFADPERAVETFTGTWCGVEGDAVALSLLNAAFAAIGGRSFTIEPAAKTMYHAASVLVSNDLVALIEAGLRCYERAGITRGTALDIMAPLARESLDTALRAGPQAALTGPVARGDHAIVEQHLAALAGPESDLAAVYTALGRIALALARARGNVDAARLAAIERLFEY